VSEERFGIEELADLGGVSRRTIRYYVQEGLLAAPLGLGRGRHWTRKHLDTLLRVKEMQERGVSLAEVRRLLEAGSRVRPSPPEPAVERSAWTRLTLDDGLELSVSSRWQVPPPARLAELREFCRRHFRRPEEEDA
jgi:DNA-binding transcriptional MerR regulator